MATTLGLNVQFTASANGMAKGLSQVDRQLKQLGSQAAGAASLFDQFASSSAAAAAAQLQTATDLAFLNSAFKTGQISAEQYAAELRGIVSAAQTSAAAFAEGSRIAQQVATAEEKRSAALTRLGELLKQGAIDQQTYDRAAAEASGANAEAAKAEEARAKALARAAAITQANLTPQQRYDQEVQELNSHLQAGRISQDTYNAALAKAKQSFDRAAASAAKYDAAADNAGTGNTLAFNELSGILSALPGPLGSVAGRISGLASAGEGLGRVFSGGLSQGFSGIAASAAGLVNPLTIGVGAFAAFGVAANAVVQGLVALEDRVERLGFAAEQLGASFQTVQVLEEAARRAGVSFDTLTNGLQKFGVKLQEARDRSSSAAKALEQLGVSQEELAGLTLPQAAQRVADALANIRDPAQRAALQLAILGQSGEGLRRALASIDEANQKTQRFNALISNIDRERINSLGVAFDDVRLAVEGVTVKVGLFAGVTESAAKVVAESLRGISTVLAAIDKAGGPALDFIGEQLPKAAANAVGGMIPLLGTLGVIGSALEYFGVGATEAASGVGDIADGVERAAVGAQALQDGLSRVALAQDGTVGAAYQENARAAESANRARIDSIKGVALEESKAADASKQAAEAAQRAADAAIEADRRRVDSLLERQRIETQFGGNAEAARAADNVLAIERERVRVEQDLNAARDRNDQATANAAAARLAELDQVLAKEREIADISLNYANDYERAMAEADAKRLDAEKRRRDEILQLEERYQERAADIQSDRIAELRRASNQALNVGDINTTEGAALMIAIGAQREDPALVEYRKQLQELEQIRREIRDVGARPVDILGA